MNLLDIIGPVMVGPGSLTVEYQEKYLQVL